MQLEGPCTKTSMKILQRMNHYRKRSGGSLRRMLRSWLATCMSRPSRCFSLFSFQALTNLCKKAARRTHCAGLFLCSQLIKIKTSVDAVFAALRICKENDVFILLEFSAPISRAGNQARHESICHTWRGDIESHLSQMTYRQAPFLLRPQACGWHSRAVSA